MRDLFDDFLEELRRRELIARGQDPGRPAPRRVSPDDENAPDQTGADASDDAPHPAADGHEAADDEAGDDETDADPDHPDREGHDGRPGLTVVGADRASGPPRKRPPGGPRDGEGEGGRSGRRQIVIAIVAVVIVAFVLLSSTVLDLWTDALWFKSVGFDGVFWTRIGAQAALFLGAFVVALIVLLGNLWLAGRLSPSPGEGGAGGGAIRSFVDRLNDAAEASSAGRARGGPTYATRRPGDARAIVFEPESIPDLGPLAVGVLVGIAVLAALTIAASVGGAWETVLLWIHRVPFSAEASVVTTDPVFHKDIGYFLFELPFLRLVQGLFNGLIIVTLILVLGRYLVSASRAGLVFSTSVRLHLAVLGALLLLSVAFGYQLDKLELVYSNRGFATGVSYTDYHAQFFAFDALTIISGIAAAFLIGGALTRTLWPLALTIGVWLVASLVIGRLYPEAIQRFTVAPNQLAQEQPFIANNIAMTRLAFDLEHWDDQPFTGNAPVTQALVDSEDDTFTNARLWDYRPLQDTLDQLQTLRKYYDFTDVDADRYQIGDTERQVWISGRELALEQNPSAVGFTNQRIIYTHGIGAVMTPVNEVANEGQPRIFIGNLPPVSTNGAPAITEPRIYFGERDSGYVVTGAQLSEFDFPTGEGDAAGANGTETRWTGTTGIPLDTTLNRLLFALRFKDLDLLISDQLTSSSQLLFHRSLSDRLSRVAPFLKFDKDPYLVIDGDGRLVYVQDAYTVSDAFPNAQAFDPDQLPGTGLGGQAIDYIRNSVKITMSAYDGTMHFYIADPTDPIVRAYAGVFPDLFEPLDAMPAALRQHLRVPEELFNVQTRVFGRYHVQDPAQFFRTDDQWTVPTNPTDPSAQTLPSEAYYVIMRMPGEAKAEFLLLQPMVPKGRQNMIAWIAARNDAPNYGNTRVYRFPAETNVFGPVQIEARIDQDPIISQQITLWNQSGSSVIRGNLIVVPLGDSLIYLQPVYLQSTSATFPEFRRIVVASTRNVVWGSTLGEAVGLLVAADNGGTAPTPSPTPIPTPTTTPGPGGSPTPPPSADPGAPLPTDINGLIAYANTHFAAAQAALRAGDFAKYGVEMARVQAALHALDLLTPGFVPSPGASASPTPSASPAP